MFPSQIELLKHIQHECLYLIKEYDNSNYEEFSQNERLSKAICRSLEIIGEAANKIDPVFKLKSPQHPMA